MLIITLAPKPSTAGFPTFFSAMIIAPVSMSNLTMQMSAQDEHNPCSTILPRAQWEI